MSTWSSRNPACAHACHPSLLGHAFTGEYYPPFTLSYPPRASVARPMCNPASTSSPNAPPSTVIATSSLSYSARKRAFEALVDFINLTRGLPENLISWPRHFLLSPCCLHKFLCLYFMPVDSAYTTPALCLLPPTPHSPTSSCGSHSILVNCNVMWYINYPPYPPWSCFGVKKHIKCKMCKFLRFLC